MAYQKGEAKYEEERDTIYGNKIKANIYLPHSCDEWVIGGKEEVLQLIEDLHEIISEKFE